MPEYSDSTAQKMSHVDAGQITNKMCNMKKAHNF